MKQNKLIPSILSILFLGVIWELIALQIGFPAIFPSLVDLLKETGRLIISENFFVEISVTILRGLVGITFAFILAFSLGIIAAFYPFWKAFFHPVVVVSRSIPVISLVLIALLWLAPPRLPVFIALITMFPILYQNILTGLEQTDKRYTEMATVFGKSGFNQFFNIYLPSAKKVIFDGLKTAMGFGWRAIIIGEALSQPVHGIGTAMKQAQVYINVSELIAWTVVAIGISYLFEYIIKMIQKIHLEKKLPYAKKYELNPDIQKPDIKEIRIENLKKTFNSSTLFESLNLTFNSGNISFIKGPSGRGKTTLLRLLAGLEKPDKGKIQYIENFHFAFSFQDIRLLPWFTITENIIYGCNSKGLQKQEISNRVAYLLENMELTVHAHKFPNELSGGQQQRVELARALAANSDILLMDEPLNGLDKELKIRIIDFLLKWINTYKPLTIWATHEKVEIKDIKVENYDL